jgi:hypothetical protein
VSFSDGVPPGGAIQGDRREIVQHIGADGQTATGHGQTVSYCLAMVRPAAPGTEILGSVLGTRGYVRVTTAKLSASTPSPNFARSLQYESPLQSPPP